MSIDEAKEKRIIKALRSHQDALVSMDEKLESALQGMEKKMERMQYELDFLKKRESKRYTEDLYKTIH